MKSWYFDSYGNWSKVFSISEKTREGEVDDSFHVSNTDPVEDLVRMLNEYEGLKEEVEELRLFLEHDPDLYQSSAMVTAQRIMIEVLEEQIEELKNVQAN